MTRRVICWLAAVVGSSASLVGWLIYAVQPAPCLPLLFGWWIVGAGTSVFTSYKLLTQGPTE